MTTEENANMLLSIVGGQLSRDEAIQLLKVRDTCSFTKHVRRSDGMHRLATTTWKRR
jgi:hypothetical protein